MNGNYCDVCLGCLANIKLAKKKYSKYLRYDNVDVMFLLLKER